MIPRRTLLEVPSHAKHGLEATTWEQRRRMTAAELIALMGPLHVNHPGYVARPRSLLPMPNLAGRLPVFEASDVTFGALVKLALRWAAR